MNDWSKIIRGLPAAKIIELLGQVKPTDYITATSMGRLHIVRVNGANQPITIGYVSLDQNKPEVVFLESAP